MTLIIQNVKEEFLGKFQEVAKNANATIIQSDCADSKKGADFESLRKKMIVDLQKSENYAVFKRLKDK